MLKAFTWSGQGRKKPLGSVLKQITWGAGLDIHIVYWKQAQQVAASNCSPKRGLPLQRTSYKSNRNKGTKKEKGKKEKQLV